MNGLRALDVATGDRATSASIELVLFGGGSGDVPATEFSRDTEQRPISTELADLLRDHVVVDKATTALARLRRVDVSKITPLVRFWLGKGVNLPLAEPFVAPCLDAVEQWGEVLGPAADSSHMESAETVLALLANTLKPIIMRRDMTPQEFLAQILGTSLRWESLGILFTAAARAAYDTSRFTLLYTNKEQRRRLVKELTLISDCCLDTCMALDSLNDLQLILQYENLIVHSQVDGDQSYHSWKGVGDVASSLFALGYHEKIEEDAPNTPAFITELRKACFARIFAADKSLAVFLGRPPRIVKDYCHFNLPGNLPGAWGDGVDGRVSAMHELEPINYTADTRCSALFAALKEEILQLFRKKNVSDQAETLWQVAPHPNYPLILPSSTLISTVCFVHELLSSGRTCHRISALKAVYETVTRVAPSNETFLLGRDWIIYISSSFSVLSPRAEYLNRMRHF
ncbi:hypothetical protein FDECE_12570 [Fusarium decemcellulare]|nr:hypothetical protein FDECE_12570 [Fusarium decemcellulare]